MNISYNEREDGDRREMNKRKGFKQKWTFLRSRIVFIFRVILKWLKGAPSIIYCDGVHLIGGASGSGKTLLMNIINNELLMNGGFGWSNIAEFNNPKMKVFDFDKVFADGDQKFKFQRFITDAKGRKHPCKLIVFDELNAKFNRRMNRQTDYNDRFMPLIKFTVTHRHQGMPRVYFIGQSMLLQDSQIQSILKVRHDVRSSKRWRYYFFREYGKMLYLPKKLIITNFVNDGVDDNGNIIWKKLPIPTKIKVIPADFESYDTFAFARLTDHLPEYSG